MQENKKQIILNALAITVKKLRGKKSQYTLGGEYGIPTSVISDIERRVKDPQLTTIFKLSEAFNLSVSAFVAEIMKELPKDFKLTDD